MNSSGDFQLRLASFIIRVEEALEEALAGEAIAGGIVPPARLREAMAHAALGGGKRFRPLLVSESAALFGADFQCSLNTGIAFELLHCYSLVHDDLPAMDNDDTRRGRPTVHRAFDEATAILAGDALQTLAFDLISRESAHPDPSVRTALVQCLARASGIGGMAGGQMLDLEAEGRFATAAQKLSLDEVERLQSMKTGALLAGCCEAGAILGKANAADRTALADYARAVGLAFQIADDLLDAEGNATAVGKAVGKDAGRGKATFVSILGKEAAHMKLAELIEAAKTALTPFGERGTWLAACAQFVAARKS